MLELGSYSEDETSSLNRFFHYQEDYKVFHLECNILQIREIEEIGTENATFPPEYKEYKEGVVRVDDTPAHRFERGKMIKYEELNIKKVDLREQDNPKEIFIGDDWSGAEGHNWL